MGLFNVAAAWKPGEARPGNVWLRLGKMGEVQLDLVLGSRIKSKRALTVPVLFQGYWNTNLKEPKALSSSGERLLIWPGPSEAIAKECREASRVTACLRRHP